MKCERCGYDRFRKAIKKYLDIPMCANCRIEKRAEFGFRNRTGNVNRFFGEKNGKTKLATDKVPELREEYARRKETGVTQEMLANKYGIARSTVANIISGRRRARTRASE